MLGVCWYPEQWPAEMWRRDVQRMHALGLEYVRLGEFSWSRLEPRPGQLHFEWLDKALDLLHEHGLRAVLGTPTATPPKWLVDRHPDILPVDAHGRTRGFGSRRHYCFTSPVYRRHTEEIVTALAQRYGRHEAVAGWQTDNEYGCHDSVRCYCAWCADAFRRFLFERYEHVEQLNRAWGNAFWSMEYGTFDEVDLPLVTLSETSPALRLDFYRFASKQVCDYNRLQCRILREHSPGRFITHNFMGFFDDLDAIEMGKDLDIASWDSYPLGYSERMENGAAWPTTGHPDMAAFHHDLYRRAGRGRWWIMEQQPGPVNWGRYNPVPAQGMIRLWTWEALAHGAEVVSYFRWRQAAHAQEQMHAGLLRPDDVPAAGHAEVQRVARELAFVQPGDNRRAPVALLFDYETAWIFDVQSHGSEARYFPLVMTFYEALRRLGLDVDIVAPDDDLTAYPLVVAPSLAIWRGPRVPPTTMVVGPRTATKTPYFGVEMLGLGEGREHIKSVRTESLPPSLSHTVSWDGRSYTVGRWREWLESETLPVARFEDGDGAVYAAGRLHWIAFWPSVEFLMDYLETLCGSLEISTVRLKETMRLRRRGNLMFAFNYADQVDSPPAPPDASFLLGSRDVDGHSVTAWRV